MKYNNVIKLGIFTIKSLLRMRTSVLRPPEAAHNYQRRPPPASSTNLRPGWSLPLPGPASVFHLDIKGPPLPPPGLPTLHLAQILFYF